MGKKSLTESESLYNHLEKMTVDELLTNINKEDRKVADCVAIAIPQISTLVEKMVPRMVDRGRLFYVGAGTSGRLGIVDASECPPTFGVSHEMVIGLMAGGDGAIRKAVEFAEDDLGQGWKDLQMHTPTENDTVIGIAASGRTPYVIGAVREAQKNGLLTGCITCNEHTELAAVVDHPIEVLVGPEFVTGSTRMKSGTAQKLILNMISTSVMIRLGRVEDNKMVDMQLSNQKLLERGVEMIMERTNLTREESEKRLRHYGSVRKVLDTI